MDSNSCQLEDVLQKCRCCFRMLIDESKSIRISGDIEERFHSLTTIELINHSSYSNIICELCNQDLKSFFYLKKDLCAKQQLLYKLLPLTYDAKPEPDGYQDLIEVVVEEQKPEKKRSKRKAGKPKLEICDVTTNLSCEECEKTLSTKISLKRHIERVHRKVRNFYCDHCNYSAFFKHSLEKHIVKHIPDEFRDRFICDACGFVSISAVNIDLHRKYEHGEVKTLFVCNHNGCQKSFSRPGQLTAHVRLTHEKRKDKICDQCQKPFSTTTRLKEHIMSAHSSDARNFACEFCAKQFLTLRQLKNHHVYHEEPKYQCELGCEKKFYKPVLLEGHHKTHLEQKDFICPISGCDRKYFLKSHLSRHIQSVHQKIKVSCEICSAAFVRKETYRSHIITHHQELAKAESEAMLRRIREMKFNKS